MSKIFRKVGNDYVEVDATTFTPDVVAAKLNQSPFWNIFVTKDQESTSNAVTFLFVACLMVFFFAAYLVWFRYSPIWAFSYFVLSAVSMIERKLLLLMLPVTMFIIGAWIG